MLGEIMCMCSLSSHPRAFLIFKSGRVVAPDSNEDLIKSPRRISAFDNVLLRDLKLDRNIGGKVNPFRR
jgi:hypothetical protein